MIQTVRRADDDVISILRQAKIDADGLTLTGQIDRKQYEAVNKFLVLAGADWNRQAKRHLFKPGARAKLQALLAEGEIRDDKKHFQAFYTPEPVANELISLARIQPGMDVLEPSAGEGAMALSARRAGAQVWCVEVNPEAAKVLIEHKLYTRIEDFLRCDPAGNMPKFDRVVMNPPFTKGQDITHVMHAYKFLRPRGMLYAIMSRAFINSTNRVTHAQFNNWVHQRGGIIRELPEGTFKESGTRIATVIVELIAEAA